MELTPRLRLMNWLVRQGVTGLPGNDLIRGFCERCRAEGLELSRGLVFIDTLHPVFEGEDRQELLRQVAFAEPRPLRKVNPAVPRELSSRP